jgi:hypothetical protein
MFITNFTHSLPWNEFLAQEVRGDATRKRLEPPKLGKSHLRIMLLVLVFSTMQKTEKHQ